MIKIKYGSVSSIKKNRESIFIRGYLCVLKSQTICHLTQRILTRFFLHTEESLKEYYKISVVFNIIKVFNFLISN